LPRPSRWFSFHLRSNCLVNFSRCQST
jgi:hypothetical protein